MEAGKMTRRFFLAVGVPWLLLSLWGCSLSGQLTRTRALELISDSPDVKATASIRVATGKYVLDYPNPPFAAYSALQSLGLLIIEDNPPVTAYDITNKEIVMPAKKGVYLTAKGQSQGNMVFTDYWSFIATSGRDVVAVTGIRNGGKGTAVADFTWKWKLNAIGKALAGAGYYPDGTEAGQGKDPNPSRNGAASFALYDDGWRLQEIQW